MAKAAFMELICFLSRLYPEMEDEHPKDLLQLGEIISQMETDCTEEFKLNKLARSVNMSLSTFQRAFKRAAGDSPANYLIRQRIKKACEILADQEKSITETAFSSGFTDSNYFSRQFKKITGMTPRAYRLKLRPMLK
jgi:transcriptional regulator GlxA family with amidase domain